MIREKILEALRGRAPMKKEAIAQKFDIKPKEKKDFYKVLDKLVKEGDLYEHKSKYLVIDGERYRRGIFQGNEKGFGFLLQEGEDVFIPAQGTSGAINEDEVLVKVSEESSGHSLEGKVIEIIKRGRDRLVGTYQANKKFGFVISDDKKFAYDIYVAKEDSLEAKDGQKVVVKITKWPKKDKKPEGKIIKILGFPKEKGVDILSIAAQLDIPMEFSKGVLSLAAKIPQEVEEKDLEGRLDLRDKTIFTIDGPDSKDFDDAVSIEILDDGDYLLGVHIADVAHYVKDRDLIDKEAYKRGNSVYLVDKVIPMLPVELSNGICSLNEGVDRLCLSVLMTINKKGKVKSHKIAETVIRSSKRLVYGNVSDLYEKNIVDESLKGLEKDLLNMFDLAKKLRENRMTRGAIDFDFPESHIDLDENGRPINVTREERRSGNKLIEEFMIICNETVAEQFYWMEVPFLYRVHEEPDEEKIESLNKMIRPLDLKLPTQNLSPRSVQELINKVKGKDYELFVSSLALRSLKKARYSEVNSIHFGLCSKYYSHFTSPIRRYSDLAIHRVIKDSLNNSLTAKRLGYYEGIMPEIAKQTSRTERLSQEAERQVESVKFAEYMESKIGEEYLGIISSITSFGIFVQLYNTIEGLVSYVSLKEYFEFNEDELTAQSRDSNKTYHIGDKVKIKVVGADSIRGNIDFEIVGDING
ncbi:ribonuclease R [Peptoniphilus catoniae]|uniref:ribonuclease R n=1 Tax=Peptoniphilus catoniae TaxID=1660341 RepID=UPI0010FED821|nr:ribonuclease R [Peptoniphilus catoniae]